MKKQLKIKSLLLTLISLIFLVTACGGDTISEVSEAVSGAVEAAATLESGAEQVETMVTAQAEVAAATPDSGPGTAVDNPLDAELGQPYSNQVNGNNFERFYRINIPAGNIFMLDAANSTESGGDASFRLMTTAGGFPSPVAQESVPVGGSQQIRFITADDGGGTYLLAVQGGMLGAVDFNFTANVTTQDDGGSGGDAMSDIQVISGSPVAGVGVYTGIVGDQDQGDTFQFTAPAYSTVLITVRNNTESETSLHAEPAVDGEPFLRSAVSQKMRQTLAPNESYTFSDSNIQESRYVVYVGSPSNGDTVRGQYEIEVAIANQDDAGSGGDAGGTIAEAAPITMGGSYDAFQAPDDDDCFRFPTASGSAVTVVVSSTDDNYFGGTMNFRLFDANGETLTTSKGSVGIGTSKEMVEDGTGEEMILCSEGGGGRSAVYAFTVNQ